ncbi:hypothetical protein TUSST3_25710 [Streptomyces sp. TUS-ST3]|uniref:hypothetical protein n=1 Tax=Streptomyces sp. TUS-ST3 TaxID=3025591 RepID=UPI00235B38BE|nr:hypothetical protein [Streptomyces sp. TUS-ST3]GLP65951.1 hypothetical protein TUSST3_25710 [Streptomyces sp. TUS-ST3]
MTSRVRGALSAALIAVACLLVPFGAPAAWAAYGLADPGRYVSAMAPPAADPAVRDAMEDEVDGPLRPFVHDFARTPAFPAAWDAGNRAVHDAVLSALRDDSRREVTVDLAEVEHRLAYEHVSLDLPRTRVAVLPAAELDRLRKGYDVLEVAGFWLPVTAAALAAAGIAVAACRRRALTATALGTALGGALLGLAVAVGRRLTLTDLPDPVRRPAAGAVYDALTATLRTVSWLLVALGLTVALSCWLTGRYGSLRARRASAVPVPDPAPQPTRAQV